MLVQALIDGCGEDQHIRMRLLHGGDAFRCGDQDQRANLLAARFFQHVDGRNHRAAGGKHWIDDDRQALFDFRDQLFQIGLCLQRFFVAGNADRADLGAGNQAEDAIEHADAGTQNRYYGNLLAGDLFHLNGAAPAIDAVVFQRQVRGRFISEDRSHFLRQFTEVLGADVCTAHQTELVADQRVADLSNGHCGLRRANKPA